MEKGDVIQSRYKILSRQKTALIAQDLQTGQKCVIRSSRDFVDPQVIDQLQKIRHSCLPRLINMICGDEAADTLILEYLEGTSLAKMARDSGGKIALDVLLPILKQTVRLLDFIHSQGSVSLLHLDLKPEHILVNQQGDVCLIDFGAACIQSDDSSNQKAAAVAMTYGYGAPELHLGKPCPASDLYSLGVTALQLLSGRPLSEVVSYPISRLLPAQAKPIAPVLEKLRQLDPAQRYTTALDLAEDLDACQQPVQVSDQDNQACEQPCVDELICIWSDAAFGCELAAVLARQKSVLVIDADLLNPRADLLLGVRSDDASRVQPLSGLDLVLSESLDGEVDWSVFNSAMQKTCIPNLKLLSTSLGFAGYDNYSPATFCQVVSLARQSGQTVVALCSQSVFDAFTCCLLKLSSRVIIPMTGDTVALRQHKLAVDYLIERDFLDHERIGYVALAYDSSLDLSRGILEELSGGCLLGSVSQSPRRRKMRNGSVPYVSRLEKSIVQEYQSILNSLTCQPIKAVS